MDILCNLLKLSFFIPITLQIFLITSYFENLMYIQKGYMQIKGICLAPEESPGEEKTLTNALSTKPQQERAVIDKNSILYKPRLPPLN